MPAGLPTSGGFAPVACMTTEPTRSRCKRLASSVADVGRRAEYRDERQ